MNNSHNHIFISFLLFIFFFLQVQGHIVVEKKSITILSPHELRGKRNGAIGISFGMPSYGESITGSLVLPKDSYGCEVFEGGKPFKFRSYHSTIVLLNRGECSFSLKVYHAQIAGAAAVLIMDVIEEPLMIMGSHTERYDSKRINEKILIPSFLIQLSFGNLLKNCVNNQEQVLLKIDRLTHDSPPSDIFSTYPPRDSLHPNEETQSHFHSEKSTPDDSKKDHEITLLEKWLVALASVVGALVLKIIFYLISAVLRKCLERAAPAAAPVAAPSAAPVAAPSAAPVAAPVAAPAIDLPEVNMEFDV